MALTVVDSQDKLVIRRFFFSKGELEGNEVHGDINEEGDEEEEYENTAIGGEEWDLAGTAIQEENMFLSASYQVIFRAISRDNC